MKHKRRDPKHIALHVKTKRLKKKYWAYRPHVPILDTGTCVITVNKDVSYVKDGYSDIVNRLEQLES